MDKVSRLKVHFVVGLDIDALPQFLELFFLKLLFLEVSLLRFTGIVYLYRLWIKDVIQCLSNTLFDVIKLVAEVERFGLPFLKEGIGKLAIVIHIVTLDELVVYLAGIIYSYLHFVAVCRFINMVHKKCRSNDHRTVAHHIGYFVLQLFGKLLIAFTGYHGQYIGVEYCGPQHIGVLTLTVFVHAKTHTTPHFLTLIGLIGTVLQRANLEHIGVIPPFFQSRVREDETCRFFKTQQPLLVLHNQVVGTFVAAVSLSTLYL